MRRNRARRRSSARSLQEHTRFQFLPLASTKHQKVRVAKYAFNLRQNTCCFNVTVAGGSLAHGTDATQLGGLILREASLSKNLIGMLAEQRRRPPRY